jgi:hypothetical protein
MRFGVVEIRVRVPPRIAEYPRGIINREGDIFALRESTRTAGRKTATVAALDMIAERTQVVIMISRTRLHSFLPPNRSSIRPISVATPLSLRPAESTKIAPRAITALLPNPRSAASAGLTGN